VSRRSAEESCAFIGMEKPGDGAGSSGCLGASRRTLIYGVFFLFGSGSAWIVIAAVFVELPIFQERFGLVTSNRMALGYNLGALCVPCFVAAQRLMRRFGREVNYRALILAIALVDVLALSVAAAGVSSIHVLVALCFVGGSCGYMAGVVHQGHILLNYDNVFVAAFWGGDAMVGIFSSLLAILQRPDLGEEGKRFSARALYLMFIPITAVSAASFCCIERWRLGALPGRARGHSREELLDPIRAPAGADIELAASGPPTPRAGDHGGSSGTDAGKGGPAWKRVSCCLPKGFVSQPRNTLIMTALGFCSSFTCWGVGDSMIPYACLASSGGDGGMGCLFRANVGTSFAMLLGTNMGSLVEPSMAALLLPLVPYGATFFLFCMATLSGGAWAAPPVCGGWYVAGLVFVLRTMQPFSAVISQRLVQTMYEGTEWEGMNQYYLGVGIAANMAGVFISTALLD